MGVGAALLWTIITIMSPSNHLLHGFPLILYQNKQKKGQCRRHDTRHEVKANVLMSLSPVPWNHSGVLIAN